MIRGNISMQNPRWVIKRTKIPQVLINIVWEYDGRYMKSFKKCVQELGRYFDHSRMLNRIHGEMSTYNIYLIIHRDRYPTYPNRYGKGIIPFQNTCSLASHNIMATQSPTIIYVHTTYGG